MPYIIIIIISAAPGNIIIRNEMDVLVCRADYIKYMFPALKQVYNNILY